MPHQPARGFTLIELLVVLVLIGTLAALVTLGSGLVGPTRTLDQEAQRLAGLVAVLADEAVLDGNEYGIRFTETGYDVLQYLPAQARWQVKPGQGHALPPALSVRVKVDAATQALATADEPDTTPAPQVVLYSSGELTPFELSLSVRGGDAQQRRLISDGFALPKVEALP